MREKNKDKRTGRYWADGNKKWVARAYTHTHTHTHTHTETQTNRHINSHCILTQLQRWELLITQKRVGNMTVWRGCERQTQCERAIFRQQGDKVICRTLNSELIMLSLWRIWLWFGHFSVFHNKWSLLRLQERTNIVKNKRMSTRASILFYSIWLET